MEFLKVTDPDKPGDYLVIAKGEFDPARHVQFAAPVAAVVTSVPAIVTIDGDVPLATTGPALVAPSIAGLTVAEALPLIEAATTAEALQALQAQEEARPNPRQGILKALSAKLTALVG